MNTNRITTLTQAFDTMAQSIPNSEIEFWYARDLMSQLGYSKWQNFTEVIEKARIACQTAGGIVENHFTDVSKMVEIGSGAERPVQDIARNQQSDTKIHGTDGRIRAGNSYGNDLCPPRDRK